MALYINGKQISGGGGGGNTNSVELTYAEYQALTPEQQLDGTEYFITDINGDGQQFQPICYSKEEREIGVWLDGKPLYEKTINVGTITTNTTVAHGIANLDTIIDYSGFGKYAGTDKTVMPFQNPANGYGFGINTYDGTNLVVAKANSLGSNVSDCYMTLRYTKTTDQAGSGTWTPQGVPAHHYSTDEQVVGTWVDGSTLYERTFELSSMITIGTDWSSTGITLTGADKIVDAVVYRIDTLGEFMASVALNASTKAVSLLTVWNGVELSAGSTITLRYTKASA